MRGLVTFQIVMLVIGNLGCSISNQACKPSKHNRSLCRTHTAMVSSTATRNVCTIQGPGIPTRSMVLAAEGGYLSDVLGYWEATQPTIASSLNDSGRGTRNESKTLPMDGVNAGDEQRKEEINKLKELMKRVEGIKSPPKASLQAIANDAASFLDGKDNPLDAEFLGPVQGQLNVFLLDYLVARSDGRKLNSNDAESLKQAWDNPSIVESIEKHVANADLQNAGQVLGEDVTISNENLPLYWKSVIFDAMRNPITKQYLLASMRELLASTEKPSSAIEEATSIDQKVFEPQATVTPFFSSQPEYVAIIRKSNGMQYATCVTSVYSSPIGGIHVDDGDVIMLVPKSDVFTEIQPTGVSIADITKLREEQYLHNAAVIKMPVLGRLTEVIVPLSVSEASKWIPADAVVSLSNYGQVPIISSSRTLMERRLRGEVDAIRNRTEQECHLRSENSPLARRTQPSDRIAAGYENLPSTWCDWSVPALLR
jgi:hypothetical protein